MVSCAMDRLPRALAVPERWVGWSAMAAVDLQVRHGHCQGKPSTAKFAEVILGCFVRKTRAHLKAEALLVHLDGA